MHAWLLLLAVLATSKPIVQVASTEDSTTRFASTAISARSATSSALTAPYDPAIAVDRASSTRTAAAVFYKSENSESISSANSEEHLIVDIKSIEEIEGAENKVRSVQEHPRTLESNQLETFHHQKGDQFQALENSNSDIIENKRRKLSETTVFEEISSSSRESSRTKSSDSQTSATEVSEATLFEAVPSELSAAPSVVEEENNSIMAIEAADSTADAEAVSSASSSGSSASPTEQQSSSSHSQRSDSHSTSHSSSDGATEDAILEHDTYSNKEIISEKLKPDPSTLVEIENSLLSLFNMKRPPKIDRSKIVIPEAMKQLYAQIMGHEIDSVNIPKPGLLTKSANTVRSFTHQDSKIDDRFPHHHRFRLHFDVKSIPADEKLKAAELQLSRDAIGHAVLNPRLANRTRYQVLVYDITRVGIRGKREPSYLLLDNKTIRLNSTDTISLDVQPAVDRWLETPKRNYGLLIEVRTFRSHKPAPHHHVRLRRSADESHEKWQHKQPLLFTYTDDGRHKSRSIRDVSSRSKRAGHHRRPHRRKNNVEICRRQSLYVDFTDVGWSDWIVAPPGYDAYYCHGKCPFPLAEHLNSTNHAVVQTLVNNLNPGKVPNACCVPTQLTGISMLYLNDQSTVVLKNYQDMTVVGCGCR